MTLCTILLPCSCRSSSHTFSFLASVPLFVVPSSINEELIFASNPVNRVFKVIYFILLALLLSYVALELLIHSKYVHNSYLKH